jgi:hypothetical protein
MDLPDAIDLYRSHCAEVGLDCVDPHPNVIDRGTYWYFGDPTPVIGRLGVMIRKVDGALTIAGSGLGIDAEMMFWAYEQGLLTGNCDLVIKSFSCDVDDVIDVLTKTPPSQRGVRIPRPGREKWRQALAATPVVIFADANLGNYVDELWEAQQEGIFSFEIRPRG